MGCYLSADVGQSRPRAQPSPTSRVEGARNSHLRQAAAHPLRQRPAPTKPAEKTRASGTRNSLDDGSAGSSRRRKPGEKKRRYHGGRSRPKRRHHHTNSSSAGNNSGDSSTQWTSKKSSSAHGSRSTRRREKDRGRAKKDTVTETPSAGQRSTVTDLEDRSFLALLHDEKYKGLRRWIDQIDKDNLSDPQDVTQKNGMQTASSSSSVRGPGGSHHHHHHRHGKGVATVETWVKNHPLEGDDIITGFYSFLLKRNAKTLKPCRGVLVPDTIVFEHNFPRGWYTTDIKSREVTKKQGRDLDTATILRSFSRRPSGDVQVLASYISTKEVHDGCGEGDVTVEVEVFNEDTIADFLARKVKHEGVLQRFIVPKGYKNTVIEAVWTPRVCMVQRRTNVHSIRDKLRGETDPYSLVVTYEGPEYLSEMGTVSGNIAEEVKKICGNIVSHFYYTEHKFITRMVLYFKVDQSDRIWFLWCSCLRVADRNGASQLPINLATTYTTPVSDANTVENEERLLLSADREYYHLTHDELFSEQYSKRGNGYPELLKSMLRAQAEAAAAPGGVAAGQHPGGELGLLHGGSGNSRIDTTEDAARALQRDRDDASDRQWLLDHPHCAEKYSAICARRQMATQAMGDAFYRAMDHKMLPSAMPFDFTVTEVIANACGGSEVLLDMFQAAKITLRGTDEATKAMVFRIPDTPQVPLAKVSEDVEGRIYAYYRRLIDELKQDAFSPI